MEILDYRSSFAINSSARNGEEKNTCRTQLLARCVLSGKDSGQTEQFFLGKECIGEHMYQERGIAQVPTAEVCIIFSAGDSSLLKKFANHDDDVVQPGPMTVPRKGFDGSYANWTSLRFILQEAAARPLRRKKDGDATRLDPHVVGCYFRRIVAHEELTEYRCRLRCEDAQRVEARVGVFDFGDDVVGEGREVAGGHDRHVADGARIVQLRDLGYEKLRHRRDGVLDAERV